MSDLHEPEPRHAHEARDASVGTIVFVGCILLACAVVIHVAVWGLFDYFQRRADAAVEATTRGVPREFRQEADQLPAQPRLEAYEPFHARVVLDTEEGEKGYYVDTPTDLLTVVRRPSPGEKPQHLNLYDIRPGTEVTLTYVDAQGQPGRPRVVRIEAGPGGPPNPGEPTEGGLWTVTGKVVRIDGETGPDRRAEAQARLDRYGWVNEKERVAHIPIDRAMQILAEGHPLKSRPAKGGEKVRPENPESSSGRGPKEGRP